MKILFFISSLFPLSFLIFLKLYDYQKPLSFLYDYKFYLYFCVPLLACLLLVTTYKVRSNTGKQIPKEFIEIKSQNFNFFIPISSYFIPFISSSFNSINDWLIVLFIIVFLGFLVIKTDLQYLNPLLIIFGGNLYVAKINNQEVYILSKNKLSSSYQGSFNKITDNLYKI